MYFNSNKKEFSFCVQFAQRSLYSSIYCVFYCILKDQALFYPKVEYKGQCMASYNAIVKKQCFSLAADIKLDLLQRLRPISNDLISFYDDDLITDSILFMFSPLYLTQIDLSWCKHITLASIQQIVNTCGENIYSMIFSGCTQFSEQDQFVSILKKTPNLKEVHSYSLYSFLIF